MPWATSSLPAPVGPEISAGRCDGPTRAINARRRCTATEWPTIPKSPALTALAPVQLGGRLCCPHQASARRIHSDVAAAHTAQPVKRPVAPPVARATEYAHVSPAAFG